MCRECLKAFDRHFPRLRKNREEVRAALFWNCTAFPFCDPETLDKQLAAIAERKSAAGHPRNWLLREMAYADAQLDAAMKTTSVDTP